jgi:hypothetical protein
VPIVAKERERGGWWWNRLKTGEKVATVIGISTFIQQLGSLLRSLLA